MNYNKVSPEIITQISETASSKIYVSSEINEDYFKDEMPIYGIFKPEVLVFPQSVEEIANIVKICYDNNIPITARGSGTGLTGSSVAVKGGVMINMKNFNNILEYDDTNLVVTVEPGVILNDLQMDCLAKGYLYPPDPGEKLATIGGNVSTNAGGMRAVKYGTTRAYVRQVEVVLPTGEITSFGSKVSKDSSGYSLLNLIIGSEGTLGIISKIVLKILPNPKHDLSIIVPFENIDDCISAVPALYTTNLCPQSIEFVEKETIEYSEKYTGKAIFPKIVKGKNANAYLIVRFDGDDENELLTKADMATDIVLKKGAIETLLADGKKRNNQLWTARGAFLEAIEAQTKYLDECDVVVPVSELKNHINFINSLKTKFDFKIISFGHAGDGNIHVYTASNDMPIDEFKKQVDQFMHLIYDKTCQVGGKLSGEHGIGRGKREYFKIYENDTNLELMRGIKKVFDPKYILNPNKVI